MFTKQDGYKMAVDMLAEIEGAGYEGNFSINENPPDDAGDDCGHKINETQDNIVYRYIKALASDPANAEALQGFCALLTDMIAIGADAEAYEEFTE